eukprot:symbB.v1.2.031838.t1/scaffold3734.1/size51279/3
MKVSTAAVTQVPKAAKGQLQEAKLQSERDRESQGERRSRCSSWLPQAFVNSFNAEGDEVEGFEDPGQSSPGVEMRLDEKECGREH